MPLNVAMVSPEIFPFAKTGGLADVAGSLPIALKKLGVDVTLFMPLYREVSQKNLGGEPTGVAVTVPLGERSLRAELYRGSHDSIAVYFLKRDEFYDRTRLYSTPQGDYFDNLERFAFFSRAVVEAIAALGLKPHIVHTNDWQSGLIPVYLKTLYAGTFPETATVFTIHNIGYQGLFERELFHLTGLPERIFTVEGLEYWGQINLLKGAIVYSDVVNTVSERYSQEIQTPEYGCGLEGVLSRKSDSLFGVLNGVDYSQWDPARDRFVAANFSGDDLKGKSVCKKDLLKEYGLVLPLKTPLIGIISRFADQKGFDILAEAMDELTTLDLAIVMLGTGEKKYHALFSELARRHPGRLGVKIAFNEPLAHKIEAGSDFFLMPSRYEPCGLNQFYSFRYGTVPIGRATGGLDDTIEDYGAGSGNGFKFRDYTATALVEKVKEAIALYRNKKAFQALQRKCMALDFSWEKSAHRYIELYNLAVAKARQAWG